LSGQNYKILQSAFKGGLQGFQRLLQKMNHVFKGFLKSSRIFCLFCAFEQFLLIFADKKHSLK